MLSSRGRGIWAEDTASPILRVATSVPRSQNFLDQHFAFHGPVNVDLVTSAWAPWLPLKNSEGLYASTMRGHTEASFTR